MFVSTMEYNGVGLIDGTERPSKRSTMIKSNPPWLQIYDETLVLYLFAA